MKKTDCRSPFERIASAMITTFVAIAMPVTMLAPFTPPEITDALRDVSIDWVSFLALALLAALVAGAVVSFKQAAD